MTETQAILRHALIAVGAAAAAMLAFGGPAVGVLGGAAGAIGSVLLARRRGAEHAARRSRALTIALPDTLELLAMSERFLEPAVRDTFDLPHHRNDQPTTMPAEGAVGASWHVIAGEHQLRLRGELERICELLQRTHK